jgi:hypothetical protein
VQHLYTKKQPVKMKRLEKYMTFSNPDRFKDAIAPFKAPVGSMEEGLISWQVFAIQTYKQHGAKLAAHMVEMQKNERVITFRK